jgi:serine protease Do
MIASLLAAALAAGPAVDVPRPAGERTYDRLKPSLFTIEVHSGNEGAKSALGSGYLVSADGHIVTNYHVVATYIDEPDRYSIRARNAAGEFPVRLLRFDLVNDLALLQAQGIKAPPLRLSKETPPPGAAIVSFGNPEGLGLSLIEGIFNGFAQKGLVDRMLLSMPLNSGMSGGPIVNAGGDVIGTNVAVLWLSNSLSFGVPARKVAPLLEAPSLKITKKDLLAEIGRQLAALEKETAVRLAEGFAAAEAGSPLTIGEARSRRLPDAFECWDGSEVEKDQGVTRNWYGCNLQFTPAIETLGEVASVELLVQHSLSKSSAYGFFGALEQQAAARNEVEALDPRNGVRSSPHCLAERIDVRGVAWKVNTCVNAYVKHPGFFDFDLAATSLYDPREAIFLSVQMKGFRLASFESLTRRFLEGVRPAARP